MMLDLARHTEWIRAKEQEERAWFDSQMQRVRSAVQSSNDAGDQERENEWRQEPFPRHPYPDAACVSSKYLHRPYLTNLQTVKNHTSSKSHHPYHHLRSTPTRLPSLPSTSMNSFVNQLTLANKNNLPIEHGRPSKVVLR